MHPVPLALIVQIIVLINSINGGVKAETRKSQASFEIIKSYARLAEHKTLII